MKTTQAWCPGDLQILPGPRHRPHMKKPLWIIILVSFIIVFLICAYMYPPQSNSACYIFSSKGCKAITDWLPPAPARELTDEEIASHVVIQEILNSPIAPSKSTKIAFMFMTPGSLPFEKLWDKFFNVGFCFVLILAVSYSCVSITWYVSMLLFHSQDFAISCLEEKNSSYHTLSPFSLLRFMVYYIA